MPVPKLISALSTLSAEEWISFKRYLKGVTRPDSDNYNCFSLLHQNKDLIFDEFDTESFRSKHFKQMSTKVFLNMLSRLFKYFEEWFALETFKNSDHLSDLLLVKGYNRRGLYKLGDQTAKKLSLQLQKNEDLHLEKNLIKAKLAYYQYYSDNPIKSKEGEHLLREITNSILLYTKEILSTIDVELVNWGRLRKIDFTTEHTYIENTISNIQDSKITEHLNSLLLLVDKYDVEAYEKIKSSLLNNHSSFSGDIKVITYVYLLNITFTLWAKGLIKNINDVGEIYVFGFEQKILLENNKIPSIRFLNIISILSKIYPKEWMEKFISKWSTLVSTKSPQSIAGLAKAITYLNTENYNLIVGSLRGLQFDNPIQKLRARILEIIAYYSDENLSGEILYSNIDNLKKVLKRQKNKISEKAYDSFYNLCILIELLAKSRYDNLKIDLSKYNNILYRSWVEKELTKKTKHV